MWKLFLNKTRNFFCTWQTCYQTISWGHQRFGPNIFLVSGLGKLSIQKKTLLFWEFTLHESVFFCIDNFGCFKNFFSNICFGNCEHTFYTGIFYLNHFLRILFSLNSFDLSKIIYDKHVSTLLHQICRIVWIFLCSYFLLWCSYCNIIVISVTIIWAETVIERCSAEIDVWQKTNRCL